MVRTDEYEARFQSIISAWLPPETDAHGETVLLMDGNKRHIRKDGLVCVSIVKAKDGTSEMDSDFRLEEALLSEVSKAPVVSRQPSAITAVSDDTKALITSSVSETPCGIIASGQRRLKRGSVVVLLTMGCWQNISPGFMHKANHPRQSHRR